jgi:hypothetical protein
VSDHKLMLRPRGVMFPRSSGTSGRSTRVVLSLVLLWVAVGAIAGALRARRARRPPSELMTVTDTVELKRILRPFVDVGARRDSALGRLVALGFECLPLDSTSARDRLALVLRRTLCRIHTPGASREMVHMLVTDTNNAVSRITYQLTSMPSDSALNQMAAEQQAGR